MDLNEYCYTAETEMSTWSHEISDILDSLERLPDSEQKKLGLQLERLHIIAENMEAKIRQMKDECLSVCNTVGTPIYEKPEAHDCIMKMNVWDSYHIAPEDM